MGIFIIAPKIYGAWQIDSFVSNPTNILTIPDENVISRKPNNATESYHLKKHIIKQAKQINSLFYKSFLH